MDNKIYEWIKDDIKYLKEEIRSIDGKVDQLLEFKWKVVGGTILASLVLTIIFQTMLALIQRGN